MTLEAAGELIAPRQLLQRAGDGEAGDVEVVQDQQRDVVVGAEFLDQLPRRGDRHALGRHDGDVEALGDLRRIEQRLEAFLLDEQDRAEAVAAARSSGTRRLSSICGMLVGSLGVGDLGEVVVCTCSVPSGTGLFAVRLEVGAARVIDDVPVEAMFSSMSRAAASARSSRSLTGLPVMSCSGPRAA